MGQGTGGQGDRPTDTEAPPVDLSTGLPVLYYDGTCGFCATSVQWVLRRDQRRTLRFAALQGETARPILALHPELASVDSVVWVEGDRVAVRSAAALAVARYLGGGWSVAARLAALVPRPIRDWSYNLIARHRHKLTANGPECLVPTPAERARFLP
jgi:predicted DCC family thiol-disulfide oxidoreductase YuxK